MSSWHFGDENHKGRENGWKGEQRKRVLWTRFGTPGEPSEEGYPLGAWTPGLELRTERGARDSHLTSVNM